MRIDLNWDTHRVDTEFALDNLSDYLNMIEGQFELLRIKENNIASQEEDLKDLYKLQFDFNFPSKIRYSIIVLLHILFETRLKALCDEISRRKNLEIKESDFKGSPIDRAKTFLKKVAKLPIDGDNSWHRLADLQKVRNCIVHCNGHIEISNDKRHLIKLSKEGIGIGFEEETFFSREGTLMIERSYCEESLNVMKSYFKFIFDSADFGPPMQSN